MKLWKQLWLWLLLLNLLNLLLFRSVQLRPELLQPVLPNTWYCYWEEFAVMQLNGLLAVWNAFLVLFALGVALVKLFRSKDEGRKKTGIVAGHLVLAFWIFWSGMVFTGCSRESARRIYCQSNLKQLWIALSLYAEENGGAYPPDLRTLSTMEYLTDQNVYHCPGRRGQKPTFSDYHYLGKGRRDEEAVFPILRDQPGNHPGRYRSVLYSDGHVGAEEEGGASLN